MIISATLNKGCSEGTFCIRLTFLERSWKSNNNQMFYATCTLTIFLVSRTVGGGKNSCCCFPPGDCSGTM